MLDCLNFHGTPSSLILETIYFHCNYSCKEGHTLKQEMSDERNSPTSDTNSRFSVSSSDDCVIPSLRFPQKLWRIVNECKSGAISWGINGFTVIINYGTFQEEFLNCGNSIFKTTNITSFIRQLNLYGFRKVTSQNRIDLPFETICPSFEQQDIHEFLHEHFRQGRLDLLSRVCRKTGIKKSLLQGKQTNKQVAVPAAIKDTQPQLSGMSRLQMCQIALTKALEQATRQYRKEKFWFQLSKENVPKDALKPKYTIEKSEPNIQIIFQDNYISQINNVENRPVINTSSLNVIGPQDKIQWEEVFTLPVENSVSISMPY